MDSFREFVEQKEFVEFILNEFNGAPSQSASLQPVQKPKPWSATKDQILQMWRNMRPDTPIMMNPISDTQPGTEHSSYGEDGIRVTGSWEFISAVMARIKEIANFENPQNKLRLTFREVDKMRSGILDRKSYVFYVNVERRGSGKSGRPNKLTF